jgi:hypothetical protein
MAGLLLSGWKRAILGRIAVGGDSGGDDLPDDRE